MNAGLILTKKTKLGGKLAIYSALVKFPDGTSRECVDRIAHSPAAALEFYLKHETREAITWLGGNAANRTLAKRFGLEFRKRAPGAGRKQLAPDAKRKQHTVWASPTEQKALKAAGLTLQGVIDRALIDLGFAPRS